MNKFGTTKLKLSTLYNEVLRVCHNVWYTLLRLINYFLNDLHPI